VRSDMKCVVIWSA